MGYPKRGEIFLVNLDPIVGTEISKIRPALIISNDIGNEYSERVIVAPLTPKGVNKIYPFEVKLSTGEGGLKQESKIAVDQIRSIDKSRIVKYLGILDNQKMAKVNKAICVCLDVSSR